MASFVGRRKICGHGLVVEQLLAKQQAGVRFSLTAPKQQLQHSV